LSTGDEFSSFPGDFQAKSKKSTQFCSDEYDENNKYNNNRKTIQQHQQQQQHQQAVKLQNEGAKIRLLENED